MPWKCRERERARERVRKTQLSNGTILRNNRTHYSCCVRAHSWSGTWSSHQIQITRYTSVINPYFYTHFIVVFFSLLKCIFSSVFLTHLNCFFLLLLFCCLQFFLIRFWCCDGETCSILSQKLLKLLVYTRRHLRSKFIANLVNSGVELLLQHIYFWSGRKFRPFNNQTNMDEKEWVCLRLSVRMKERKGNEIKAYAHTRMNDKQNSQNKN